MPIKAVVKKAITRPRLSGSTIVCSMVLMEAVPIIMPNPAPSIMAQESQNQCEKEKAVGPAPKTVIPVPMTRPMPRIVLREAR